MKNYIKDFSQFQRINEQELPSDGGLEELAAEANAILSNKYDNENYTSKGTINPINKQFTEIIKGYKNFTIEGREEVTALMIRWYNPGELIDIEFELIVIDRGNGKYQIDDIDRFATDLGDRNEDDRDYGDYYICSAEVHKGNNIGAIVNKETIIEIIQELLKHQDLDWSDGGEAPEGSGPYSIQLKSAPGVTLELDAYYD
tara:strand:- start:666 stop:1268 length:603 start_codon:yes stop_codon:yes gene_type:complete